MKQSALRLLNDTSNKVVVSQKVIKIQSYITAAEANNFHRRNLLQ